MADTKISGLPASTTPLAGTEVLPIVQSGATKQVTVSNLTSGRFVNASSLSVGNTTDPGASNLSVTGSVGVGTTSPNTKLHVYGSGSLYSQTESDGAGNVGIRFKNTVKDWYLFTDSSGSASFYDATANANRFTITSSGNIGVGTASPSASAILDAQSTTKGVRMPNMTTTQKNAISSPEAGLMVFDTTLAKLCVFSGTTWQTITSI